MRIKALEGVTTQAEISRDDYKVKLDRTKNVVIELTVANESARSQFAELDAKYNALIQYNELDIENDVHEGRKDLAAMFKVALDQVKSHLEGRDAIREPLIKASERKANYELLDEIIKGEIDDLRVDYTAISLDKVPQRTPTVVLFYLFFCYLALSSFPG